LAFTHMMNLFPNMKRYQPKGIALWLVRFAILSICLLPSPAVWSSDQAPALLVEASTLATQSLEPGSSFEQSFIINETVLQALAADTLDEITVRVAENDIVFQRLRHKSREKTATWVGVAAQGNARILITIGADHFFGRVVTDEYTVLYTPGKFPLQAEAYIKNPEFEVVPKEDAVLPPTDLLPSAASIPPMAAAVGPSDDGTVIDIMVLYTDGMAAAYPGAQIDTKIQELIDVANNAFVNSNIDTQLRLVHSAEVDYPDGGEIGQALDDLTNNVGVFSGVEAQRTAYGADQVTLLRLYVDDPCGIAWLLKGTNTTFNSTYSYAVVHEGSKTDDSGWYCSQTSFGHELGHNLGCAHDIANASSEGKFSYSYGYQQPEGQFRTMMAYQTECPVPGTCPRIDYFSNPNITYDGEPTGVAYTIDNARTIQQTRIEMAAYRTSVFGERITVIAPNGNEVWYTGNTVTITWSSENLSDNISIELYDSGSLESIISASTANDGSYSWTIPEALPSGGSRIIRISSTVDTGIFDDSDDFFAITPPPPTGNIMPAINMLLLHDD
jgi:hypothetical protein